MLCPFNVFHCKIYLLQPNQYTNIDQIDTMSYLLITISNTIELTVHTSCYSVQSYRLLLRCPVLEWSTFSPFQVADSCAAILGDEIKAAANRDRSRSKSRPGESSSSRSSRRDEIDKFYKSESYCTYLRTMPRHRRSSRDPKTPDKNLQVTSTVWSEKMSNWKSDVNRWVKKRADPQSRILDKFVKNDLVI